MNEELQPLTFGDKLRLARESKNISAKDIADSINISERNILNIEQNKIDSVPLVFYRDYVRTYAKLVGVSSEETEAYLLTTKEKPAKKEVNYLLPETKQHKSKKFWWFLILIILIVVGAITAFDYYKNQQDMERVEMSYYIAQPPASSFDS